MPGRASGEIGWKDESRKKVSWTYPVLVVVIALLLCSSHVAVGLRYRSWRYMRSSLAADQELSSVANIVRDNEFLWEKLRRVVPFAAVGRLCLSKFDSDAVVDALEDGF